MSNLIEVINDPREGRGLRVIRIALLSISLFALSLALFSLIKALLTYGIFVPRKNYWVIHLLLPAVAFLLARRVEGYLIFLAASLSFLVGMTETLDLTRTTGAIQLASASIPALLSLFGVYLSPPQAVVRNENFRGISVFLTGFALIGVLSTIALVFLGYGDKYTSAFSLPNNLSESTGNGSLFSTFQELAITLILLLLPVVGLILALISSRWLVPVVNSFVVLTLATHLTMGLTITSPIEYALSMLVDCSYILLALTAYFGTSAYPTKNRLTVISGLTALMLALSFPLAVPKKTIAATSTPALDPGSSVTELKSWSLPHENLYCTTEMKLICGVNGCAQSRVGEQEGIVISRGGNQYNRCDSQGCGEHPAIFSEKPNTEFISVQTKTPSGVSFKYSKNYRTFVDSATLGLQIYISFGKCENLK